MASRYYPNPDDNFVIHGSSPSVYREVPGFMRNSMLTGTTKNLTQHTYHPNEYHDDPVMQGNLRKITRNLNRVSGELQKSLLKEDIDRARLLATGPSYTQQELNEALADALNSYQPPKDLLYRTDWYTKPIHLSSSVKIPMSREDVLADQYFPMTLGETKSIELLDDVGASKQPKRSRSKNRPKSAKSQEEIRREARRLNNLFLLASETPYISHADVTFTSPYSDEISKLRMEKLRIEERQYLELKRQSELERIRGPKPKWYELKGPEFHYEAQKNNELLRNSRKWEDLLQYRERLVDATTRLRAALADYEVPVY